MRFISQSIAVCLSFGIIYIWEQSFLSSYTLFIIAIILLVYFGLIAIKKIPNIISTSATSIQIFVVNIIIFLLVFSTGSLTSPLFFLLYFIAFGVAFVLNPVALLLFSAGVILVFLPDSLVGDVTGNFIRTGSVALLSPIAYMLVREFKEKNEGTLQEPQTNAKDIIKHAEDISTEKNELEKIKSL